MFTRILQKRLAFALMAAVACPLPNIAQAQINPFNMGSEFGAHMNFNSARDFANHATQRWNRYNQQLAASGGKEMMFRFELGAGIIVTDADIKFSLRSFHDHEIVHDTTL